MNQVNFVNYKLPKINTDTLIKCPIYYEEKQLSSLSIARHGWVRMDIPKEWILKVDTLKL